VNLLSVDTTSREMTVALSKQGGVFSKTKSIGLNNYENIISLIENLLKRAALKISQIDILGVCVGPGSFTGIRIGLSTLKALAYANNIPIVEFKSLDLDASMIKERFGLLCVMRDARRNNVYTALYSKNRAINRISNYSLCSVSEALNKLKKIAKSKKSLSFYGDAVYCYDTDIKRVFPDAKILLKKNNQYKANAMISMVRDNTRKKFNAFTIKPFYMYPRDCQVRKTKKIK